MAHYKSVDPSKRENIFELAHPENYRCRVSGYFQSHSYLWLTAVYVNHQINLIFTMPQYFEGSIRWVSANFMRQSDEECLAILQATGLEPAPEVYKLYTVETRQGNIIKIIAEGAHTSAKPPGIFG